MGALKLMYDMKKSLTVFSSAIIAFSAAAMACSDVVSEDLEAGFRNPPQSAGVRAFWWWLNSNVTREAITRDLEEMEDKGFSGALIFDADGSSQRGNRRAPAGPVFGSPEWTELFVHACREAKRLGLELSLNIQSGWNLGGPQVTAEEATQALVWSKTELRGPAAIEQVLSSPRSRSFYRDVAVVAVPIPEVQNNTTTHAGGTMVFALQASSTQHAFRGGLAMDGDPDTFWVSASGPDRDSPQWLLLTLSGPARISELSLQGRKGYGPRECTIQVSLDNKTFRTVKEATLEDGERLKASFEPQAAKFVRLLFTSAYDVRPVGGKARNVQVTEIALPGVGMPAMPRFRPIRDLKLKNASRELGMSAPDCRFLLDTAPALPGELAVKHTDILNLSAKMDRDGMLRWDVPKGEWVVLRIGHTATGAHVSTESAGWGGRVLDYMNPDSLRKYWQRNLEPLFEAIGPMAGTTLRRTNVNVTKSWELQPSGLLGPVRIIEKVTGE